MTVPPILLQNPFFDDGTAHWLANPRASITTDNGIYFLNPPSLKITHTDLGGPGGAYQVLPSLKENQQYWGRWHVNVPSGRAFLFWVDFYADADYNEWIGEAIWNYTGTGSWQDIWHHFKTPPGTVTGDIGVYFTTGGTSNEVMYVDATLLHELPDEGDVVVNGNFSQGLWDNQVFGWQGNNLSSQHDIDTGTFGNDPPSLKITKIQSSPWSGAWQDIAGEPGATYAWSFRVKAPVGTKGYLEINCYDEDWGGGQLESQDFPFYGTGQWQTVSGTVKYPAWVVFCDIGTYWFAADSGAAIGDFYQIDDVYMERIDIDTFARRIYNEIEPVTREDHNTDHALLEYLKSMGVMYQEIDDYASDGPDGEIGWSILVDIERTPRKALPWLAQFVGSELPQGLLEQQERDYIADLASWRRGTKDGMIAAVRATLTGNKSVLFVERYNGGAYQLLVSTYTSETPDPTLTEYILRNKQKPAGIVLTYTVLSGQNYLQLRTNYASYTAVKNAYSTYADVKADTP